MAKRILIVEDEADLAELLAFNLQRDGYVTEVAADGVTGLRRIIETAPDLVVLDVMLPGMSGLEVAKQVRTDPRTSGVPILMLTARAEESDQVEGLDIGADDYVTKPFSTKVLRARIEAMLRRSSESAGGGGGDRLRVGPIDADLGSHRVTLDDEPMQLTLTEFRLLISLMRSKGKALSRNDLIARAMGPGVMVTARTIDVHVASIRKKLGSHGEMIQTVRGVGYRLDDVSTPAGSGLAGGGA